MRRTVSVLVPILTSVAAAVLLVNCGGGGNSSQMSQMATVNLTVSDPAPCGAPQGPFAHVFLAISDVQIHQSADAGPNDAGWVDLTPSLANSPQQVDMLGIANNQCFLASLGSTTALGAGSFQQIRVFLLDDSQASKVSNNQCASAANCVVLSAQPNTPFPLKLSSESKTGIKIPSGQIAGGHFVIGAGQVKDLNIDFNACESIVEEGNGKFRLKPVLHAGEVSTSNASITGKVVDSATGMAIVGGNTVVALEQNDGTGVDRVIMETVTDSAGNFVFCPVPAGTYDIVAAAINGAGTAYAATAITGVQPGNALGNVPATAAAAPASMSGQVTTSTGSAATSADLSLSALQSIMVNGSNVMITTPLAQQSAATATITTAGGSCPMNTDCATYTLSVPAANPSVGAFSSSGNQTPAPPEPGTVNYTMDANAFVPGSPGVPDCSPSNLQTSLTGTNAPLTVTAGSPVTVATLAFTGCQ
jgi:Domain of unknown function (DUF4382)